MTKRRTGYLSRRGKTYYCTWRVNGRAISKALYDKDGKPITTLREAETARAALMAPFTVSDETSVLESISAKMEGRKAELARIEDQQNPPLPIARAWDAYLATPNRPDSGESTLDQYLFQFDQFELWMKDHHADKTALRDVTKEIAEEYATHLVKRGLAPTTFNKHINMLTLIFRVLTDKAKLVTNPWQNIQRKHMAPHSRRELIVDELTRVCESATGEMRLLLALGIYTGLRLGDCATLRWGEVDLQRGIIRRIPMKTARRRPRPVLIPIHATLRKLLEEIPVKERGEYVLPETAEKYQHQPATLTDRIQAHFKACGIVTHKLGTGQGTGKRAVVEVGYHSLRHSFVSLCRSANAPLAVVEAIVGHSSPAMTRHYTHLGEDTASAAVNALPAIMMGGIDSHPKPALPAAASAVNGLPSVLGDVPANQLTSAKLNIEQIRALVDNLNGKNWHMMKEKLLATLDVAVIES